MILRFAILTYAAVMAYLLLCGWPAGLTPVVRACLAVLVLVAAIGWWGWQQQKRGVPACGRRRPGLLDIAAITAAALALESGFVWLLCAAPAPLESLARVMEQHLLPQAAAVRHAASVRESAPREGNELWNNEGRRPIPKRTNFKPGNRPELFLRLRDAGDARDLLRGQVYVRAFALSRYERAAWSAFPGTPEVLQSDAAGLVQMGTRPGRAIVHEVFHGSDPKGQNVFTSLQGAVAVAIPQLTRLDDGLLLLPPSHKASGYEYVASSKPLRMEDLPDGVDIRVWPDSPAVWTDVPETGNFAPKLRALATLAAGTGTLPQRLLNLRNHLRTTLEYSLVSNNLRDLDPIDNFLFAEQRGHCEYFATAGALLARVLGVPTRVAYGWAGGTYYESSNLFVFRAREAHAWAEVCLDGYGWVVLDPTPPAALNGDQARVAPPDEMPPGADRLSKDNDPADPHPIGTAPAHTAMWLTFCFGLPALVLLLGRGVSRQRASAGVPDARESALHPPDYLSAWRRAAAQRGVPMPAGMTLRSHLARLGPGLAFSDEFLCYHYGTRYEGWPTDARREKLLVAEICRWEGAAAVNLSRDEKMLVMMESE